MTAKPGHEPVANFAPVRFPEPPPPPTPEGPAIEFGPGYRGAPRHAHAGPYRAPVMARPSLPPRAPWWRRLRAALWSVTGRGRWSTLRARLDAREVRRAEVRLSRLLGGLSGPAYEALTNAPFRWDETEATIRRIAAMSARKPRPVSK